MDNDGRVLASSSYNYQAGWQMFGAFQRARSGQATISTAYLPIGANEPILSFTAPVSDQDKRITGVLVGEVPVVSVASLVVGLQVGKEGHTFLVNSIAQMIANRDTSRLMETRDTSLLETQATPGLFRAREDRKLLYAIAPVAAEGMLEEWQVVLQMPQAEAYAYLAHTRRLIMFIAIGTITVIVLVAAGLALSISRPVRRVASAARRMAKGELAVRVEASSGGELDELATSFNGMAEELQAKVQTLRESRARIVTVEERVRREIASHLHGRVQGRLLALRGRLQEIRNGISPSSETARQLTETVDIMGQVIDEDLSVLSRRLYPSILRRGLVPALQSLSDQFITAQPIEMKLDEELIHRERAERNLVPEPVRLATYRIAEEALTNVVKYARASQVTLSLALAPAGWLRLTVSDNGRGFNINGIRSGMGMAAIQDYAEAVGGNCVIRSAPGEGTEVSATLPLAEPGVPPPERTSTW